MRTMDLRVLLVAALAHKRTYIPTYLKIYLYDLLLVLKLCDNF